MKVNYPGDDGHHDKCFLSGYLLLWALPYEREGERGEEAPTKGEGEGEKI